MSETTANENIKFLDSDVPDFGAEAAARAVRDYLGNVLKVFKPDNADFLIAALNDTVAAI